MPDPTSNGMQCHEFDSLLGDAIDGVLSGLQLDRFQAHARSCSACGPLLAEVEAGRNWLKELTEVEPRAGLVNNILASTTGVDTQRLRVDVNAPTRVSLWERAQAWVSATLQPVWATARQPRFAMSFGMAFFSLSVALSVLGVKPADLRQISLRPAAIRHTYYNTQARVVRYYENIRFVYEVESRVREFKRDVAPAEPRSNEAAPSNKDHKNTTQQPEQKQERNYSSTENHLILASAPLGPSVIDPRNQDSFNPNPLSPDQPVVPVTTYRRFV
ncbi:MAG TPA: zf-HC2 domain-containing protein [Candidatus Sulfotelmatobacter sp.]